MYEKNHRRPYLSQFWIWNWIFLKNILWFTDGIEIQILKKYTSWKYIKNKIVTDFES